MQDSIGSLSTVNMGHSKPRKLWQFFKPLETVLPALFESPTAAEGPIKRVLDLGANGIIVPQVNTPEQAADVVRWAKYAPIGSRGVGLGRAHGYGANFANYMETANDEVCVIVQAEHKSAVDNIEQIVSVPGVDGIQLGPYDLSSSMNKMGKLDDPDVVGAIDKIMTASKRANLPIGCFGITAESVQTYIQQGSHLICAGVDTLFLSRGASIMSQKLRESE